ncbi:MAG TPA: cation diffusion facilitator family transporter [Gaiellaceae bacterium]|nr:cation diffusion facilitator family transporter [Gaiellaceae bacterium]
MSPQRRTALLSVLAAGGLALLKLVTGLVTGSLGLLSEALHSGTDLVAALLTFFAVGVSGRPADRHHAYGHGKAENLAALAEAAILALLSLVVAFLAIRRFGDPPELEPAWWVFAVIGVVIVVDATRMTLSFRAARRYQSAALHSNALHFASDLAGSTAVLVGLLLARSGRPEGDAVAALFVAVLVIVAAVRLMRGNIDVLMDSVPDEAEAAARAAISELPGVELRRLRMRQSGDRQFADVVIGVPAGAAVGQGHAAADAVEEAVQHALPRSDVVVHVEPEDEKEVRDRAHAAALGVPGVREVHNVNVLLVGDELQISLHLKLPGALPLDEAHEIAERVERAIREALPSAGHVQTHIEPLAEAASGAEVERDRAAIERLVHEETGRQPRELRFLTSPEGTVAHLTLEVDGSIPLAEAHAQASRVEERIRLEQPEIHEVIVHTEP